jgi:hypothetical protein
MKLRAVLSLTQMGLSGPLWTGRRHRLDCRATGAACTPPGPVPPPPGGVRPHIGTAGTHASTLTARQHGPRGGGGTGPDGAARNGFAGGKNPGESAIE